MIPFKGSVLRDLATRIRTGQYDHLQASSGIQQNHIGILSPDKLLQFFFKFRRSAMNGISNISSSFISEDQIA